MFLAVTRPKTFLKNNVEKQKWRLFAFKVKDSAWANIFEKVEPLFWRRMASICALCCTVTLGVAGECLQTSVCWIYIRRRVLRVVARCSVHLSIIKNKLMVYFDPKLVRFICCLCIYSVLRLFDWTLFVVPVSVSAPDTQTGSSRLLIYRTVASCRNKDAFIIIIHLQIRPFINPCSSGCLMHFCRCKAK